jgi:hypothetical protein
VDILNNREWALILWVVVIFIYVFLSKKMKDVRWAFKSLVSALFVRQIQSVLVLMMIYMGCIIYVLSALEIWSAEQFKNTLVWCVTVGFMSLFKLETIKKDRSFFKHSVIDNLKLIAIIEFVVGVYTFPLLVEVILVPVLALISVMTAMAELDQKHATVKSILESVLAAFGLMIMAYTVYMLITNFNEIAKAQTLYDFTIPPLLTLLYLPFVFFMMVYTSYEQVFIRLRYFIKNSKLRYLAMLYSVLIFNIRIKLLERWASSLAFEDVDSHEGIVNSIKRLFKISRAEKSPVDVPFKEGWSPYKAKDFLIKEGLQTGYYNKSFDEWCALSPMIEFGEGLISDNIAYYVEGTETAAKTLKLKLNVNDASRSDFACKKLLDASEALCKEALNEKLTDAFQEAIIKGKPLVRIYDGRELKVEKDEWPSHAFGGYDIKFVISSIY